MTILEALRRVNAYPVPMGELQTIAIVRGLDLDAEADGATLRGGAFKLATADVLMWLSEAPNVSQDGISYSFLEEQRRKFKGRAQAIYGELAPDEIGAVSGVVYGYKGSVL